MTPEGQPKVQAEECLADFMLSGGWAVEAGQVRGRPEFIGRENLKPA
jgi:hypothetical protein